MSETKTVLLILLGALVAGYVIFAIWFGANFRF